MTQPQKIGKYEVIRPIGEGATSTVFLGFDPFAQRHVAIKRMHARMLRDKERGRLYRHLLMNEASLAGKLIHPHIAQIYDASVLDDDAFVVMEYVPGGTLEAYTQPDHLLPFERLVEIIFKSTRALDYAFRQGITHRDIKPANILLVDADGQDIKISDFGAAYQTTSETTQVIGIGSPAYMSPQQVSELPVDQRTDIYSLGVVMYQLLTGRLPFDGETNYNLLYRIAHETPPPPSSLRGGIPASLDAIVQRAMEKDIDRRYQGWNEFSYDLAQAFKKRVFSGTSLHTSETQHFQTLRELTFFSEFSDVEIWEIVGFSKWETLAPADFIMREGEAGDSFCFLTGGEASVKKRGKLLNYLGIGDCFGEMSMFSAGHGLRTATVQAQSTVEIVRISASSLQRASDTCRMHFYKSFLEVLSTRLAMANSTIVGI